MQIEFMDADDCCFTYKPRSWKGEVPIEFPKSMGLSCMATAVQCRRLLKRCSCVGIRHTNFIVFPHERAIDDDTPHMGCIMRKHNGFNVPVFPRMRLHLPMFEATCPKEFGEMKDEQERLRGLIEKDTCFTLDIDTWQVTRIEDERKRRMWKMKTFGRN